MSYAPVATTDDDFNRLEEGSTTASAPPASTSTDADEAGLVPIRLLRAGQPVHREYVSPERCSLGELRQRVVALYEASLSAQERREAIALATGRPVESIVGGSGEQDVRVRVRLIVNGRELRAEQDAASLASLGVSANTNVHYMASMVPVGGAAGGGGGGAADAGAGDDASEAARLNALQRELLMFSPAAGGMVQREGTSVDFVIGFAIGFFLWMFALCFAVGRHVPRRRKLGIFMGMAVGLWMAFQQPRHTSGSSSSGSSNNST